MTELSKDICYLKKGSDKNDEQHKEIIGRAEGIDKKIDTFIEKVEEKFTRKDEFIFWRNLLVGIMITTIFMSILLEFLVR